MTEDPDHPDLRGPNTESMTTSPARSGVVSPFRSRILSPLLPRNASLRVALSRTELRDKIQTQLVSEVSAPIQAPYEFKLADMADGLRVVPVTSGVDDIAYANLRPPQLVLKIRTLPDGHLHVDVREIYPFRRRFGTLGLSLFSAATLLYLFVIRNSPILTCLALLMLATIVWPGHLYLYARRHRHDRLAWDRVLNALVPAQCPQSPEDGGPYRTQGGIGNR